MIPIPDLSAIFRILQCVLITAFFIPLAGIAQDEESAIELTAKGRASLIFFADRGVNSFEYAPSGAAGLHFGISKNFGKWGVETGIGADRMSFVQRTTDFPYSTADETVEIRMHYFAVQIPLSARYKVSENFRATAGLNFTAANLNAYAVSVSSGTVGISGFESGREGDFPGYQITAEVHTGVTYRLSPRLALAAHFNFGLHPLSGIDLSFDSEDEAPGVERFEYNWFRTGIELVYRFN